MSDLGKYLREKRREKDQSLRAVERQSREISPDKKDAQISNGYLYQLEEGNVTTPHPLKLQTLARIYETDYYRLLELVGYIEPQTENQKIDPEFAKIFNSLPHKIQDHIIEIVHKFSEILEDISDVYKKY